MIDETEPSRISSSRVRKFKIGDGNPTRGTVTQPSPAACSGKVHEHMHGCRSIRVQIDSSMAEDSGWPTDDST